MIYYFALCKLNNENFETTIDADKTTVEIRYFTSQNYNKPEVGILRARPYFSELFLLKYFLVDRLANAKNFFWLAIFYRKIGPKITFDFEDPGNPGEITF